jgi:hypothetical protein
MLSPQRNINISHKPLVEAAVPVFPKFLDAIIVTHTFFHIFNTFDSFKQSPSPWNSPEKKKFEPNKDQKCESKHAKLIKSKILPYMSIE